jgi:hypothetical protein
MCKSMDFTPNTKKIKIKNDGERKYHEVTIDFVSYIQKILNDDLFEGRINTHV